VEISDYFQKCLKEKTILRNIAGVDFSYLQSGDICIIFGGKLMILKAC